MNLKERKLQEAKTKLIKLQKDLIFLQKTNSSNQQRIVDCKHAIQKQQQIIQNIKDY